MALTTIPLPYGLRDVKLTPYTTDAATVLGTAVDLPNARTLAFTEAEEFTELRGDDHLVTTHGRGAQVDWNLEAGGISLEAYKVLAGGTITESGTTPNQVKTYLKDVSETRGWFQIEGQVISDSGGDVHAIIHKAKATGALGGTFGDGAYYLTAGSGIGVASTKTGATDDLYTIKQNETAAAIS